MKNNLYYYFLILLIGCILIYRNLHDNDSLYLIVITFFLMILLFYFTFKNDIKLNFDIITSCQFILLLTIDRIVVSHIWLNSLLVVYILFYFLIEYKAYRNKIFTPKTTAFFYSLSFLLFLICGIFIKEKVVIINFFKDGTIFSFYKNIIANILIISYLPLLIRNIFIERKVKSTTNIESK